MRSISTAAIRRRAALIERLWSERMRTPARPLRDAKDRAAGMGAGARPADAGLSRGRAHGPDHDPEFRVAVELPELAPGGRAWAARSAPPSRPPPPPC